MKIKQEHLVLESTDSYRKTIVKVLELDNGDYYIQGFTNRFEKISLEQFIQMENDFKTDLPKTSSML